MQLMMQSVKNVFWNGDERRVRALWRLIGQLLILLAIALPTQIGLGAVALMVRTAQGGITTSPMALTQSPPVIALATLAILAAILASVWLAGRFLDRRPFADFGFHIAGNWWRDLGFGLFLGAALMLIIFLIELGAGWVSITGTLATRAPGAPFFLSILLPLTTFVAVGIYEELLSRGYHLRNMAEGLNWTIIGPHWAIVIATLISSALFGLAHLANPNASFISSFNIFVAGAVLLAAGYLLTGELAIPIGVHITWNFFQGNVFGFPVSGANFGSATFIRIQQGGPEAWTGGAFGPEAGLLGLGAILLGGLTTALWVRWRYGRVGLYTKLAEYE
jgi:membrane protease YdiL (CAAX protease family)